MEISFLLEKQGGLWKFCWENTVASFETQEMTDGQLSKNKTCENEFYTIMEQSLSIKKLHACSLSIKKAI